MFFLHSVHLCFIFSTLCVDLRWKRSIQTGGKKRSTNWKAWTSMAYSGRMLLQGRPDMIRLLKNVTLPLIVSSFHGQNLLDVERLQHGSIRIRSLVLLASSNRTSTGAVCAECKAPRMRGSTTSCEATVNPLIAPFNLEVIHCPER